jgi:hypothetical protein
VTRWCLALASAWFALTLAAAAQVALPPAAGPSEVVAGLRYAQLDAGEWVNAPGPLAVFTLRLDPARVRPTLALAQGTSPALETVPGIAARAGAIAAVNAGFFLAGGRPAGLMAMGGVLLSPGLHPRAAVGFVRARPTRLLLDQVKPTLSVTRALGTIWPMPWFEPQGGTSPLDWLAAESIVGGAGLILSGGRPLDSWDVERMRVGFATDRHPRTVIGRDGDGWIWLVAIDGRRPGHSVGATFADLVVITARLGLVDAVNLDGGGSTTMVVQGVVVNRPSDVTGPRPVSDAILVLPQP